MKKLPRDAEASNVLVGEVDFLDAPFVAFVRLHKAVMLGALTEVPVPTRYGTISCRVVTRPPADVRLSRADAVTQWMLTFIFSFSDFSLCFWAPKGKRSHIMRLEEPSPPSCQMRYVITFLT